MKKQEKKRSKLEVIGKKGRQEKREESGIAWEERENHQRINDNVRDDEIKEKPQESRTIFLLLDIGHYWFK